VQPIQQRKERIIVRADFHPFYTLALDITAHLLDHEMH
jgi:hypothetical protein